MPNMQEKQRNHELDAWRLVFAFVVLMLHTHGLNPEVPNYPFWGGYLAVEFFLMVTGYFTARSAFSEAECMGSQIDVVSFMKRKFSPIYRAAVPAILLHYLAVGLVGRLSLYEIAKSLFFGIFEVLLLSANGMYVTFHVLPVWYLSALVLILPLFYYLLWKKPYLFQNILSPLSCFLIYGYIGAVWKHMDTWYHWAGIMYSALPRAWAGLCLGVICYTISKKIAAENYRKWFSHLLSLVELFCFGAAIKLMYSSAFSTLDYLTVFLLSVGVCILLSQKASINRYFPKCAVLSEFSLFLYVSHWTVRMLVPILLPEYSYYECIVPYLICSVIYAAVLLLLTRILASAHICQKLKKLILAPQ